MPEDWDSVWELISMGVHFMIPYFMRTGSIHVENLGNMFFRLGES